MAQNYWSRVLDSRFSRRRTLAATGAAALGAAFLAACGGSSGSSGPVKSESELVAAAADTTKQAKRGGEYKIAVPQDFSHFDLSVSYAPHNIANFLTYNTLTKFASSILSDPTTEPIPDLAESWEFSPDGTQLTMKIRQGVKWHNKAPVNGRALTMEDVLFSFNRASRIGSSRGEYFNAASPNAPILSWSSPDSRTLVLKLKEPFYYILQVLAASNGGNVNMLPAETDTTFDSRKTAIGTGAYEIETYNPSANLTLKRNTEYWDKSVAYADKIAIAIVPEYAAGLAQFTAGNLHTYLVQPQDIIATKKQVPELNMYKQPIATGGGGTLLISGLTFGLLPQGKSPFVDERVRQAVSMAIDRDLFLEASFNISTFTSQGLPIDTKWNSAVWADRDFAIDPRHKDFGPNAKYFKLDIAESKKLLAAAGYGNGVDVTSSLPNNYNGSPYQRRSEILDGMLREIGFRPNKQLMDYASEFTPKYRDSLGQFEGWAVRDAPGSLIDAPMKIRAEYYSKGGAQFLGFAANGRGDKSGDPYVDAQVEKMVKEFDRPKRMALAHDLQRYLGKALYDVKYPGGATSFSLAWPVVKNYTVFRSVSQYGRPEQLFLWLDETQAPNKKS